MAPPCIAAASARLDAKKQEVLAMFRHFDKNGDGTISYSELAAVVKNLDGSYWTDDRISRVFREIDKDNSQSINFEEFVSWTWGDGQQIVEDSVKARIDGIIAAFDECCGRSMTSGKRLISRQELATALHRVEPSLWTAARTEAVLNLLDTYGDGWVDYSEFGHWLRHSGVWSKCPGGDAFRWALLSPQSIQRRLADYRDRIDEATDEVTEQIFAEIIHVARVPAVLMDTCSAALQLLGESMMPIVDWPAIKRAMKPPSRIVHAMRSIPLDCTDIDGCAQLLAAVKPLVPDEAMAEACSLPAAKLATWVRNVCNYLERIVLFGKMHGHHQHRPRRATILHLSNNLMNLCRELPTKADVVDLRSLLVPPDGVETACAAAIHLLAGFNPHIMTMSGGRAADTSWQAVRRLLQQPESLWKSQAEVHRRMDAELPINEANLEAARAAVAATSEKFPDGGLWKTAVAAADLVQWVTEVLLKHDIAVATKAGDVKRLEELVRAAEVKKVNSGLLRFARDTFEELLARRDGLLAYTSADSIWSLLAAGHVTLVKGSWLLSMFGSEADSPKSVQLPRRQELPAEAVWDLGDLQEVADALAERMPSLQCLPIVVVSYCWLKKEHPDPENEQMQLLCSNLELLHERFSSVDRFDSAVFIDYCSLYQLPRSPSEEDAFLKCLSTINIWYAHQQTIKWLFTAPTSYTSVWCREYSQRGWPTFERCIASMITRAENVLDLGNKTEDCENS
eukprot:TRINITY_DN3513_c1_g1_i1.p1 TRINITY_DN3513_c1_g1~~TRINITY_DN3513_c1_g1_i1.p1  ORF type:complete len:737 (-),score=166.51 TRINITY_DN3513_c1_g1_i1:459-2669(-)